MPEISVVIPVYNTEKYLQKCLDSIVNQTLADIEIICIDNGSKDKSPEILNDFLQKDKRIKLIHFEKNVGASKARNIGINEANGKYISFVDSDDFIDTDFLEKLYKKAKDKNADAAKGNIYNYDVAAQESTLTDFYNMNGKIRKNKAYFYYGFTGAIYKKSFLDKYNIRFPENINYFEDTYFSIQASIKYNKLCFDNSAKYYYSQYNQNSVANHATLSNFKDFRKTGLKIINLLNVSNISKYSYNIILGFLLNFAYGNYNNDLQDSSIKDFLFETIIEFLMACKYEQEISDKIKSQMQAEIRNNKFYDMLLEYYKKYDYLNKKSNNVKILISYIKPSFLFKTDILTPIHLGRAIEKELSKDGIANDEEIYWLHKNCIGDNDFEGNISRLNRRIGFCTGTYWAWKNYQKLGNPEYFGSMGYRKLLFPNALENLSAYDFVLPMKTKFNETLKSQFIDNHGNNYYKMLIDAISRIYPEELKNFNKYFNSCSGYFAEMYIMKKALFFDFCKWIFKVLNYLLEEYPAFIKSEISVNKAEVLLSGFTGKSIYYLKGLERKEKELRDIAFIIERITGYYLYKLTKNKKFKYKEVLVFEPEVVPISKQEYKKVVLEQMRKNVKKSIERTIK